MCRNHDCATTMIMFDEDKVCRTSANDMDTPPPDGTPSLTMGRRP
jgi:hypothetical protein